MKNSSLNLLLVFTITLLFVSCNSTHQKQNNLSEQVIAYIHKHEDVMAYGYVDYQEVKRKSEIEEIPELGDFVNRQLKKLEEAIDFTIPVYYTIKNNGRSGTAFFAIKDKDKMTHLLEDMGMFSEEEDKIRIFEMDDFSIGFSDQFGAITYAGSVTGFRDELATFFDTSKPKEEDKEIREVLRNKTDILLGVKLNQIMDEWFTQHNHPEKSAKLQAELKNAQSVTTVDFNDGSINIQASYTGVGKELQKQLAAIFDMNQSKQILKAVGQANNEAAFVASLDLEAIEKFALTYFMDEEELANYYQSLYRSYGNEGLLVGGLAEGSLTNVVNGNFGVSLDFSTGKVVMGAWTAPAVRMYVGLGKEKQNVFDLIHTLSEGDKMIDLGSDFYAYHDDVLKVLKNEILIQNNSEMPFEVNPLNTQKVKNFGLHPVSFFFDVAKYGEHNDVSGQLPMFFGAYSFDLIDYISFDMDSQSMHLDIYFKNPNDNALKQVKEQAIETFKAGGM